MPTSTISGRTDPGLAVASKLVSHLHGKISVDSELGSWTELVLFVPTLQVSNGDGHGQGDGWGDVGDKSAHRSVTTCTTTDFKLVNRKVLRKILLGSWTFAQVDDAKDGQEAVDMTVQTNYDVIWMDISMPRLNGMDATRIIKGRRRQHVCQAGDGNDCKECQPDLEAGGGSDGGGDCGCGCDCGCAPVPKIFFVTAHAVTSFEKDAMECGGDGYITKPYSKEDVGKALGVVVK